MSVQPATNQQVLGVTHLALQSRESSPAAPGSATAQTEQNRTSESDAKISLEQLQQAARKTQDFVQAINSSLQFTVDDTTGTTVVKVVDVQTQDVIRQIPSEEMLAIAKALDRLNGLLLQNKA